MSENIELLAKALVAAQGAFPTVAKDAENPFFKSKYADLATVIKTASPVLSKNGLAVSQWVSGTESASTLVTYLIHESGQYMTHEMPLLLTKQDAQGQGSAITYARRYSYMAVLGLVADVDDDGNAASAPSASTTQTPAMAHKASTGNPVSDKQASLIKDMLKTKFTDKESAQAWLVGAIGTTSPTNSAEASTVIDGLMKLSNVVKPSEPQRDPIPTEIDLDSEIDLSSIPFS